MLLKEFVDMLLHILHFAMNVLKEAIETAVMLFHIPYPMGLCSPPGSVH